MNGDITRIAGDYQRLCKEIIRIPKRIPLNPFSFYQQALSESIRLYDCSSGARISSTIRARIMNDDITTIAAGYLRFDLAWLELYSNPFKLYEPTQI